MIPWECIDSAPVPDGDRELHLFRRGSEFSIRVAGCELMNSRMHGSEESLAKLACARIAGLHSPRLLIGGLGMGYTLAAALQSVGPAARVTVAELVPAVVAWNRDHLATLAGQPLADHRVTVQEGDVLQVVMAKRRAWDAILLDVDNGPAGLTSSENNRLYGMTGLTAAFVALRPGGVLAVWSVAPNPGFNKRLQQTGFLVDELTVRARGTRGGRHTLWFARRAV